MNSSEDGPVGPKHVEIRRYMNKIEIVTSVGFSFHIKKIIFPDNFLAHTRTFQLKIRRQKFKACSVKTSELNGLFYFGLFLTQCKILIGYQRFS